MELNLDPSNAGLPNLGLVCITTSSEVRYRTITRKRLLSVDLREQETLLQEIYLHNLGTLFRAIDFCTANNIRLYRIRYLAVMRLEDWRAAAGEHDALVEALGRRDGDLLAGLLREHLGFAWRLIDGWEPPAGIRAGAVPMREKLG